MSYEFKSYRHCYIEVKRKKVKKKVTFQLPARESLTTPRSVRAPIGRKPTTLPHQRVRKENKEKSPDGTAEMDSPLSVGGSDLRRQNEELRARLAGESADHKRRLETYRRAQQGQAALVSRLQAKVLQYKQRCAELESQMLETPRSDPQASYRSAIALPAGPVERKEERIADLDTALRKIEEEKHKCEKLVSQNNLLREQLEESHQLNEALTNDLQKLTNDWETLRDEMAIKEDEWKDEEQAFNDYYSSEHNRLLNLWREVVSVKRFFSETQSNTERELFKVKSDIDSAARELVGTLSGFAITAYAQGAKLEPLQTQLPQASSPSPLENLRVELHTATSQRDAAQSELRERDSRIQRLLEDLQALEDRCEALSSADEEVRVLRAALEDVARALIQDSDERGGVAEHHRPRSPGRASGCSTLFAESAVSALHAALNKYQIQIHDLQVRLQNAREQLSACRKSCEVGDTNNSTLEKKVQDLQEKLDQSNSDLNQLVQEKESMLKTIEALRADKNNLERNRLEINSMVESLTSDYEKLQKMNTRLEKNIEVLLNEKRDLNCEVDRLHREGASREAVLRGEEERSGRLRSELVSVREDLHKEALARELLEQQKIEGDGLLQQLEKHRSELEIELERTLLERSDLQDLTEKLQTIVRSLEDDKKKLLEDLKQMETDKSSLLNQSSEQQSDMNSLRKELLAAEQNRMEVEADKASLQEKIKFLEGEREKVEIELRQVMRERGELSSQLTSMSRKKESLNEEMMRLQQRLEQAGETIGRLNRTLDDRVKNGEEKQILIDSLDKDRQHLQEQLAGARSEKDALEAALFEASTALEDADTRREALTAAMNEQALLVENYKGQIARLSKDLENSEKKLRETRNSMTQSSGKKEAEYQTVIANLNKTTTDNITKLKEEKEQLRQSLEQKLSQTIAALTSEKEAFEASAREREKKLLLARDQLILQHDEAMLRAENDKQQALLMAHQEHQALIERLEEAKRILSCEQNKLERVKRDAQARFEHDRNHINQLKDDLSALKTRLEEAKAAAEDECVRYENRIKEIHLEKEGVNRELQETKAALSLAEDKYDGAYGQLQDTLRKLKDLENESECLRKDLTDVRRQLSQCSAERDKYNSACRELRDHVKRAEHERREAARTRDEAYQRITSLEENRTTLELELSRVQTMLKESESGGEQSERALKAAETQLKRERAALEQAQHDIKELQSRLQNSNEDRERTSCEAGAARRHAAELEAALQSVRGDLAHARTRAAGLEDALRDREQELVLRLEDCRSKERRLEELKHNLEVCLADATQQIQELKTRVGASEGRCRALEASLSQSESSRREVEAKLSTVAHCLKRVCGLQADGSLQTRRRLASPSRKYSPHRGIVNGPWDLGLEIKLRRSFIEQSIYLSYGVHEYFSLTRTFLKYLPSNLSVAIILRIRNEVIDVDPEMIKKGVKNLMHEVCQIERERDDCKAQLSVLKKQLKEATEQQGKGEGKVPSATSTRVGASEGRCRALEASLSQSESSRREVEAKLSTVAHCLKRVCGLQADGSLQTRRRLASPSRKYSPHRGRDHSEDRNEVIDVDPEMIKKGVKNLMHEVCQIERERDDCKAQLSVLKKQLKEATEQQGKGEGKVQALNNNLRGVQEEKARLQATLGQRDVQITSLNEVVQTKTVEVSSLRDKITSLEATLASLTEEKLHTGNKSESLRAQLAERVQEVAQLREALTAAEARASRLDVRRAQLEGDVQRAGAAARERESALKVRILMYGYTRTIASLEDRCTSLKGTVEQLSTALQKAATAESELRTELARTQRLLSDAKNNENNVTDKMRHMQKSIGELTRNVHIRGDSCETWALVDLESQLRMAAWDGKESHDGELERELHLLQRERSELKSKNDALQDAVRKLEAERRRPALRSKSHDRNDKNYFSSDIDSGADSTKDVLLYKEVPCKDRSYSELSLLELENRELKMKIRRLEKELADKESELSMARNRYYSDLSSNNVQDADQYRQAAIQAERLLEAREASHRQQIMRLENQLSQLRAQLSSEIRRRQAYVARSGRAARDVQRLRTALGDSLRTVSQDPALDSYKLEHEARKLDNTLTQSLPPLNDSYESSK
ncbi:Rootletin [Danaus plexippus plexippus]|uniref:Rootletin n=1 Tax=Danaus plexippus plexippus TaxID=278856 RepID=A0A212FGJ2_DANPL|nr:Rootletin [Danaus plexippus plexippus]